LVGVAVKVTKLPEQMVVAEAAILTLDGSNGFTVMLIAFEMARPPETQVAFEVIKQVTTSLLARVLLENVGLLVPILVPFNFHW
jgi:hypothetical protein